MARVTRIRLNEADLDKPLYRIFPIWLFELALVTNGGNLALVPPNRWDDPQEDPCARIQMSAPDGSQKPLDGYLKTAYAQCWSSDGQSDALLRSYSRVTRDSITGRNTDPKLEGVRVTTTLRLIEIAIEQYLEKRGDGTFEFFLAKIEYISESFSKVANRLCEIGPTQLGSGFGRAHSLSFKRKAFAHEQEVRIIAVARSDVAKQKDIVFIDIDKNQVFQKISFDPRLSPFEREERKDRVLKLGYSGKIVQDRAYQATEVLAKLPKHWDALDADAMAKANPKS